MGPGFTCKRSVNYLGNFQKRFKFFRTKTDLYIALDLSFPNITSAWVFWVLSNVREVRNHALPHIVTKIVTTMHLAHSPTPT